MRKAKKLIAGIMLACMFIAGTGVEPSDVYAAGTTAGSLEKYTGTEICPFPFTIPRESVTVFAWEFVSVSFCVFSSTSDPFVRR